jgi:hypothetical protein
MAVRPAILQLDEALAAQTAVQREVAAMGGRVALAEDLGPPIRLWTRQGALEDLRRRLVRDLPTRHEADLVFAGSGDFHHVTPLLVERAIAQHGGPVTVLHFDNHPDWARFAPGRHCGSWVGRAARLEAVARVVTVGVCSEDVGHSRAPQGDLELIDAGRLEIHAWRAPDGGEEVRLRGRGWPTIEAVGEAAFLDRLEASLPTGRLYVTIDKDVLRVADAITNWDQGCASLEFLLQAVRRMCAGRTLIGADVVGDWSEPVYGGPALDRWLKRGEAFLDQPRPPPGAEAARLVNEAANLRLLRLFAEVAT